MHEPLGPLNRIVLEFVNIPLGKNGSRQDKTIIFPNYLTTASVRWIKQKATQASGRIAEKTCEKTNDTDREEQDTGKAALLCWEL